MQLMDRYLGGGQYWRRVATEGPEWERRFRQSFGGPLPRTLLDELEASSVSIFIAPLAADFYYLGGLFISDLSSNRPRPQAKWKPSSNQKTQPLKVSLSYSLFIARERRSDPIGFIFLT